MHRKLKILHLEDVAADAELIGNALKKERLDFERLVVDTKEKYIQALSGFSPDIILADHSLASFNSHEALKILHEMGMKVPFLLVTSTISQELVAGIIKEGADDYITKDSLTRLPSAVLSLLEKFRLEKEKQGFLDEIINKEKRYRALVESSADAIVIFNFEGKPTYTSPSLQRILGYSEQEAMQLGVYEILHPDDRKQVALKMTECLAKKGIPVEGYMARIRHKDNSWRWVEATLTNMLHDPAINGIVDNFRDVTERKLAEEKIIHLNRLYSFLSQINQAIVHSADEKTVFKKACSIAIEIGKFKAAWIGELDIDNQKINLVEGSGILPEDISKFKNAFYEDNGPQGHVLRTGTYYICNNIPDNLTLKKWKPLAADWGYGSCIVLPIRKLGRTVATFNLYASELNFFTSEEIALLTEATGDISFALDTFEKQQQKLQADNLVKHKELRLNQAQAIAHLGSWELNFITGVLTWSEEGLRIHGLSPDESHQSYETWRSLIHPDDLNRVLQVTKEAYASLSNSSFAHRIVRKDGTVRHVFSQAHFELSDEGKPVGLHGITHDITEIKEAEEQLRESESNLQAIFGNTSEGFILTDVCGVIKCFNNTSKETIRLNTNQEIAVGDSIFDFVHPSRKAIYQNAIEKVLRGETLKYDYPYTRNNGETKWFDFTVNPVYNGGHITGLSITSADITQRKQADQKLQESELFNKGVLASLSAHIAVIDKSGLILAVNKAWDDFAKENGVTSLERVSTGSNYLDVCRKAIADGNAIAAQVLEGIFSVLKNENQIFELEYSCHSPSEERWFMLNVSNFGNDGSKVVISHQDISKRKKSEDALRESESNLQAIFENTSEGFILTDIKGDIKSFNNKAKKFFS